MLFVNMKEKGSWVLIFSQMSRASDVLEDYCLYSELRSLFFSLPFLLDVECIRIYWLCPTIRILPHRRESETPRTKTASPPSTMEARNSSCLLRAQVGLRLTWWRWSLWCSTTATGMLLPSVLFIMEGSVKERTLERASQKLRVDQLAIQQHRTQQVNSTFVETFFYMLTNQSLSSGGEQGPVFFAKYISSLVDCRLVI